MDVTKVALVTGAASGIGLALTQHLLGRGYKVGLCDVDEKKGSAYATQFGPDAHFVRTNVACYEDQLEAFRQIWDKWGRLDFVAANAGIIDSFNMYAVGSKDTNTTPPPKPNLKTIDINLTGVIYTTVLSQHYFSRNKSPGGKIIITASSAALYPLEVGPLYAASKSAIPGLVRSMASHLNDVGVTINCICPGVVATGLTEPMLNLWPKEKLTPYTTIMKAYDRFLDGAETGCVAEISTENIYLRDQYAYGDEVQEWICANFPRLAQQTSTFGGK